MWKIQKVGSLPNHALSDTSFPFSEAIYPKNFMYMVPETFYVHSNIYMYVYIWNYLFFLLFNTGYILFNIALYHIPYYVPCFFGGSILLQYNLHTSNNFVCTCPWVLANVYSCVRTTTVMMYNISITSVSFLLLLCMNPLPATICFLETIGLLSITVVLPFKKYHENRIKLFVMFWVWFLSLSIKLLN